MLTLGGPIRSVYQGESVISPQMMTKFVTRLASQDEPSAREASDPATLTRREKETLRWIARGVSNKEIARAMGLAESTVKVHVQSILRKLGVASRVQAAVYAIEHGLDN